MTRHFIYSSAKRLESVFSRFKIVKFEPFSNLFNRNEEKSVNQFNFVFRIRIKVQEW